MYIHVYQYNIVRRPKLQMYKCFEKTVKINDVSREITTFDIGIFFNLVVITAENLMNKTEKKQLYIMCIIYCATAVNCFFIKKRKNQYINYYRFCYNINRHCFVIISINNDCIYHSWRTMIKPSISAGVIKNTRDNGSFFVLTILTVRHTTVSRSEVVSRAFTIIVREHHDLIYIYIRY